MKHRQEKFEPEPTPEATAVDVLSSRETKEQLTVLRGHTADLVTQLTKCSRQERIARFCPKDAAERFTSPQSFEKWRSKDGGRTTYFLTDEAGDLSGLIWYGPAELPDGTGDPDEPNHTFAIRLYDGAEGKGLARPFILRTIRDYVDRLAVTEQLEDFNGIHLQTDSDNAASLPLYRKVGFKAYRSDAKGRVTMILPPDTIYEICTTRIG